MPTRKERNMSSSAAEAVADVEELLTQILESLPLKSLARFKCVSTHWLSLISDLHNHKISAFFSNKFQEDSIMYIPLGNNQETPPGWNPFKTLKDSVPDGSKLRILQSCNGLFLILCHIPSIGGQKERHAVYVANPTSNQFRVVPSPRKRKEMARYGFVRYALAFDPSKSPHYKVVCVINSLSNGYVVDRKRKSGHHKISIFSSETGKWNRLQNTRFFEGPSVWHRHNANHFDYRSREGAIYCNGAVHWIRDNDDVSRLPFYTIGGGPAAKGKLSRESSDVMHYFDRAQERLLVVSTKPPIPSVVNNIPLDDSGRPSISPRYTQRYFGESGGRLYMIETYKHCNTQFDVMEMPSDYSGWFVKYIVDLNPLVAALPGLDWKALAILCLSQDQEETHNVVEEDSLCDLWLHMPGKVLSYNLKNETLKTSIELANKENLFALYEKSFLYPRRQLVMYPYMKSLASVRL